MKKQLGIFIIVVACAGVSSVQAQIGEGFRTIGRGISQVASGSVNAVTGLFRSEKKSEAENKKHESKEIEQHVQEKKVKRKKASRRGA